MNYAPSWNSLAKTYFEKVIQAHGGWSAWDKLESIPFKLNKFTGGLVLLKGLHRSFFKPQEIVVLPKIRKVDFVYPTHTDTFENGKITFSTEKKIITNGRDIFKKTTFEQWHSQHVTYFFGYAWANYMSYPFNLPEFELHSFQINKDQSAHFKIKFPKEFHTHCEIQTFYFNKKYQLQKHEYFAECAGPLVYGSHTTEDYFEHQGIQLARVRKVRPMAGSLTLPAYGIYGEIETLMNGHN